MLLCQFCMALNPDGTQQCSQCLHRPGVARALCDCPQCRQRFNHPTEVNREARAGLIAPKFVRPWEKL